MWTTLRGPGQLVSHAGCCSVPASLRQVAVSNRAATGHCQRRSPRQAPALTTCMATSLQFIKGVDEETIPDVKLTRSRDGSNGTATFIFPEPAILNQGSEEKGEITGLYMVDDEGVIQTVEVAAKFVNGKPDRIEAVHVMKTTAQWDRFMRFMERYAEDHDLGFNKSSGDGSA